MPQEEYRQLKGSMWAFRKHPANLRPEERPILRTLFKHAPVLKQAYTFRLELTAIFEQDIPKAKAEKKIRAWINRVKVSKLTCFNKFIGTLEHWWDEITNFFHVRANSGFVEGLNNKIKVLKRRCYGIFNLEHLFQRIFLDLEGYYLFAWQPPDVA